MDAECARRSWIETADLRDAGRSNGQPGAEKPADWLAAKAYLSNRRRWSASWSLSPRGKEQFRTGYRSVRRLVKVYCSAGSAWFPCRFLIFPGVSPDSHSSLRL